MKKKIIIILVIIILIAVFIIAYFLNRSDSNTEENNANIANENTIITNDTENIIGMENNVMEENRIEEITENGTLEVGTTEQRGFIIDNVYHS